MRLNVKFQSWSYPGGANKGDMNWKQSYVKYYDIDLLTFTGSHTIYAESFNFLLRFTSIFINLV